MKHRFVYQTVTRPSLRLTTKCVSSSVSPPRHVYYSPSFRIRFHSTDSWKPKKDDSSKSAIDSKSTQDFGSKLWGAFSSTSVTLLQSTASLSRQAGSKVASFAGKQASQAGGWLWTKTSKTTSAVVSKASERISSSVQHAKDQTASRMQRNATKVKQSMGQGWTRSRNLIIGWSLAAIAVYGVATTVSKEVVQYYLKDDDSGKKQRQTG